jgi:hypothetical protein
LRPRESLLVRSLGLVALGVVVALAACAGAPQPASPAGSSADGGAADAPVDAAPAERPFAGTAGEATQLIGAAVDKRSAEVNKCVAEYRARKKLPHERVEISVGIDQEGKLLGAALKGRMADPTLSECMTKALTGAPFPRSHAGVIQITKSFEEIVQ